MYQPDPRIYQLDLPAGSADLPAGFTSRIRRIYQPDQPDQPDLPAGPAGLTSRISEPDFPAGFPSRISEPEFPAGLNSRIYHPDLPAGLTSRILGLGSRVACMFKLKKIPSRVAREKKIELKKCPSRVSNPRPRGCVHRVTLCISPLAEKYVSVRRVLEISCELV
jgi:hypothetical protein